MLLYAVDLGSTTVKVAVFGDDAALLAVRHAPMRYDRRGDRVEFDADEVVSTVLGLIHAAAAEDAVAPTSDSVIVVTGQAESFVLVGADDRPLAPAISWMDERSWAQALEIAARFDSVESFAVTGEPEATPTWPATKLRWLAEHRPDLVAATRRVLMIKDYLLLRLTGLAVGERSTRGFTYLYDVQAGAYWPEMVEFCGLDLAHLPELVAAGADLGPVTDEAAALLPDGSFTVNAGALDHFAAMVGTGTYRPDALSASAGTVLALSALVTDWSFDPGMRVSFHTGLDEGDTVLFTGADSGGVSLSWYLDRIARDLPFDELERELSARDPRSAPLFLPYLTGVNPPDFDPAARGAFLDLQLQHDRVDLAFAVMEGVAHLLRRNLHDLARHGYAATSITSAGGGTASSTWNQLKADAAGVDLHVPDVAEDACRGAAILALRAAGRIDSLVDASGLVTPDVRTYHPRDAELRASRYAAFEGALTRLYPPRDKDDR